MKPILIILALLLPFVEAHAEKVPSPKWILRDEPFALEVTVLSVEEREGPHAGTTVRHRVRVDRVERGEGLARGDETDVVSRVHRNPPGATGTSGHRGGWRGPNGLPVEGDRARLFAGGTSAILEPHFTNGWQPAAPRVAFVAADDEYRSEVTMPFLADLVDDALGCSTTLHLATDEEGARAPDAKPKVDSKTHLTSSHAMRDADLLVAYMRFEQLEPRTLREFLDPLENGLPLVAFRTSTHAFAYPDGHPSAALNAGFGERFLGSPWRFHHGHSSRTRVLAPAGDAANHPILAGVAIPAEGFVVRSWLYHVEPLPGDCTVLLWGEAVGSERGDAPARQPILWTRELPRAAGLPPQRIAYASLGHPEDFARPEIRAIAAQMVAWALSREREIDDAERAAIRESPFSAPPTR